MALGSHPEPPGLADTAFRVVEAGQRVLLDRLDLARLDLERFAALAVRSGVAVAASTVLLSGAWFAIMAAAALYLQAALELSLPVTLCIVAALSAAGGVIIVSSALKAIASFQMSAIGSVDELRSVSER
jgi:hypothetical protein